MEERVSSVSEVGYMEILNVTLFVKHNEFISHCDDLTHHMQMLQTVVTPDDPSILYSSIFSRGKLWNIIGII